MIAELFARLEILLDPSVPAGSQLYEGVLIYNPGDTTEVHIDLDPSIGFGDATFYTVFSKSDYDTSKSGMDPSWKYRVEIPVGNGGWILLYAAMVKPDPADGSSSDSGTGSK